VRRVNFVFKGRSRANNGGEEEEKKNGREKERGKKKRREILTRETSNDMKLETCPEFFIRLGDL